MSTEIVFETDVITHRVKSEFHLIFDLISHHQSKHYSANPMANLIRVPHRPGKEFAIRDGLPRDGYVFVIAEFGGPNHYRMTIQGVKQEVQPQQAYFPGAPDVAAYAVEIASIIEKSAGVPRVDASSPKTVADVGRMLSGYPEQTANSDTESVSSTVEQTTPTAPPKKALLKANVWLIQKHLEEGIPLKELEEEWLDIRDRLDFKYEPLKPLGSMKTVIKEEKERRKGRN